MDYNAKLLHAITDASTILDCAREILVNGRPEATPSSEFLFRSVESNIFGVVRARTVDEASQILSEQLGESVELLRVDDDLVFWSSRSQA